MPRFAPDVPLAVRLPPPGAPLRHRIAEAIVDEIRRGALRDGDLLPSSRVLAADLGVSRSSVIGAYDELTSAGFAVGQAGSGTRVALGAAAAAIAHPDRSTPDPGPSARTTPHDHPTIRWDLSPGHPDSRLVSVRDWRRSWRAAAVAGIDGGYAGIDAHPGLRSALAAHLRRSRGIATHPDDVVIFASVSAVLRTVAGAAGLRGRVIAFEDPGFFRAAAALESSGVVVRPVAVDANGLDPMALTERDAAVYCTPAHQYPLGARMPVARRAQLLAWAHDTGGLIIEDDYDSEFRYDVTSLPPLRALHGGRDHVLHIGTASKVLTPSLRLAWLLAPPALRAGLDATLRATNENAAAVSAAALAHFLESGAMSRHLARTARTYRARRAAFVEALHGELADLRTPGARVVGVEAGLHVVLELPDHIDDEAVARDLRDEGLVAPSLAAYRRTPAAPRGLVCGYAQLPETQANDVAATIFAVLRRAL
ncbi:MAG TPA: PLP-dependent aminotransferase family protein [Aldersonia sp.]